MSTRRRPASCSSRSVPAAATGIARSSPTAVLPCRKETRMTMERAGPSTSFACRSGLPPTRGQPFVRGGVTSLDAGRRSSGSPWSLCRVRVVGLRGLAARRIPLPAGRLRLRPAGVRRAAEERARPPLRRRAGRTNRDAYEREAEHLPRHSRSGGEWLLRARSALSCFPSRVRAEPPLLRLLHEQERRCRDRLVPLSGRPRARVLTEETARGQPSCE